MAALRYDRYPSMAASAALHAAVIALALISWPWAKTVKIGDVVAVTLVTSSQAPAPAQAVQAPVPAPAQTEAPVPQAQPQPAAPVEAPTPPLPPPPAHRITPPTHATPPQPQAQPQPQPLQKVTPSPQAKATRPPPPPARQAQTPPKANDQPDARWDALSQSLSNQARPTGARQSQATRGPTRANQAIDAQLASGPANAAAGAALTALTGELAHMWNPNCGVRGSDVTVKVTFKINAAGRLDGTPRSSADNATDPGLLAASERAVRPVYQASPFADPQFAALYGQTITVNFNQKSFCSNR